MKELDEIRARLEAAAEGPWRWDEDFDPDKDGDSGLALTNGAGVEIIGAYNYHCCSYRDDPTVDENSAELIANAPTDLARLLAAVAGVEQVIGEKDRIWAAICENTCGKDIHGVDHEAIADTIEAAIRAAITAALTPTPAVPSGAGEPRGAVDDK